MKEILESKILNEIINKGRNNISGFIPFNWIEPIGYLFLKSATRNSEMHRTMQFIKILKNAKTWKRSSHAIKSSLIKWNSFVRKDDIEELAEQLRVKYTLFCLKRCYNDVTNRLRLKSRYTSKSQYGTPGNNLPAFIKNYN